VGDLSANQLVLYGAILIGGIILGIIIASLLRPREGGFMPDVNTAANLKTLPPDEQIKELLRRGNKIGAIKLYREQTGLGLKEAKDTLDAVEVQIKSGAGTEPAMPSDPMAWMESLAKRQGANSEELLTQSYHDGQLPPPDEVAKDFVRRGRKIEAIKRYREQTNVGLKEAKDAVEAYEKRMKAGLES